MSRPLAELDPRVLDLLRLGAYQLIDLRVPSHAAVDTTVDLTRAIVGTGASGLVNAVLRKVAAGGDREQWLATPRRRRRRAAGAGHRPPAVDRRGLAGRARAATRELEAALLADDAAPEVHLVARRIDRDDAGRGVRRRARAVVAVRRPAARRRPGPAALGALRRGRGAGRGQPAGRAAAQPGRRSTAPTPPGWTCAPAPAARPACWPPSVPTGVRLTAADRAPHRAELVRRALAGEDDVEVLAADGTAAALGSRARSTGCCSTRRAPGSGALRRRPEVRWRRTPDDVPPLVELQTALLDSALASVRAGGVVAYVTCSPHAAETVAVVDAAAARDDVEVLPVAPLFPEVPGLARGDYGQLWPHRHGTDAMFMALLRRTR